MKSKLLVLTLSLLSVFSTACTKQQQQSLKQQQQQQQQQRAQYGKQQPIGGVESSISKAGDIERVKVATDNTNIRTGCSTDTTTIQSANKDAAFDVVGQVPDWFAVKLSDGKTGFVPKSQCKPVVVEDKKPTITPETTGTTSQAQTAPKTPTAQTNSNSLSASEQQMIKLVNDARAQNNLKPLQVDIQLSNVARTKSQDMIDNNYFSHNSPKYGSPFDMMKSFGIKFIQAGENIAGNQNVQNAFNALMNSPGHRKNMLSPDFTHIGIGIRSGGPYGNMFTQQFITK